MAASEGLSEDGYGFSMMSLLRHRHAGDLSPHASPCRCWRLWPPVLWPGPKRPGRAGLRCQAHWSRMAGAPKRRGDGSARLKPGVVEPLEHALLERTAGRRGGLVMLEPG